MKTSSEVGLLDVHKLRLEPVIAELWHRMLVFVTFAACILVSPFLAMFYATCVLRNLLVRLSVAMKSGTHVATGMDAFWYPDQAGKEHIINGVLILDGDSVDVGVFVDRLRVIIADDRDGTFPFQKLRQRLRERWCVSMWEDHPGFDVDDHVVREPTLDSEDELRTQLEQLSARPFQKFRPQWQMHIIPLNPKSFPNSDGGAQFCLLFRVDHMITDGICMIYLLLKHAMDSPTIDNSMTPPQPRKKSSESVFFTTISRFADAIFHAPSVLLGNMTRTERSSLQASELGTCKIIRWSKQIPLSKFKDIKRSTGATINDIFQSALAGAFRRYFLESKAFPEQLTAVIPVSLHRSAESIVCLENKLTFGLLPLSSHIANPWTRLNATCRATEALKKSPELIANAWTLHCIFNCVPGWITGRLFKCAVASLISSSLPGPQHVISICGHRLRKVFYLSPHKGTIGISACMMSYDGEVTLVLYVDRNLVKSADEVDTIVKGFEDEITLLDSGHSKISQT